MRHIGAASPLLKMETTSMIGIDLKVEADPLTRTAGEDDYLGQVIRRLQGTRNNRIDEADDSLYWTIDPKIGTLLTNA